MRRRLAIFLGLSGLLLLPLLAALGLGPGCGRGRGIRNQAVWLTEESPLPDPAGLALGEGQVLAVHRTRHLALIRFKIREPGRLGRLFDPEALAPHSPVYLRLKNGEPGEVGRLLAVRCGEYAVGLAAIEPPCFGWFDIRQRPTVFLRGAWRRADEVPAGFLAPHLPETRDLDPFIEGAVAAKYLVVGVWETATDPVEPGWYAPPLVRRRIREFVAELRENWRAWSPDDYVRATTSADRYWLLVGLWRERARVAAQIELEAGDLAQKRWGGPDRSNRSEANVAERLAWLRARHAEATSVFLKQVDYYYCRYFPYAQKECATLRLLAGYVCQSQGDRVEALRHYRIVVEEWPTADPEAVLTAMIRTFGELAGNEVAERPPRRALPAALVELYPTASPSPTPRPTDVTALEPTPPGFRRLEPVPFGQPVPSHYPFIRVTKRPSVPQQ